MADPDIIARLEALETPHALLSWSQGPPPPRLTEHNRLLSEAKQRREAELRAICDAEEAKVRAAEEEANRRAYAAWLANEPQRQKARADLEAASARLAELNLRSAPVDAAREELRERIRELNKVANEK